MHLNIKVLLWKNSFLALFVKKTVASLDRRTTCVLVILTEGNKIAVRYIAEKTHRKGIMLLDLFLATQ